MRAGRLKERIAIIRLHRVKDAFGYEKVVEKKELRAHAEVRHDRGERIEDNGEIFHTSTVTFITWLSVFNRIDENDIVEWRFKRYRIISLEPAREVNILYIKTELINE